MPKTWTDNLGVTWADLGPVLEPGLPARPTRPARRPRRVPLFAEVFALEWFDPGHDVVSGWSRIPHTDSPFDTYAAADAALTERCALTGTARQNYRVVALMTFPRQRFTVLFPKQSLDEFTEFPF